MLQGISKKLSNLFFNKATVTQEQKYKHYLAYAYPSNHSYRLAERKLRPSYKLAKRYKSIRALFPLNLTSFVDIGCSKGFFVFSASHITTCVRTLGIDVNAADIEVCRWVAQQYLKNSRVNFEKMPLQTLAENIDEFGGPFQTVLLFNTYQYLYFGSQDHPGAYHDHELIFQYLRKICCDRVIFTNRIEFADCQQQVKQLAEENGQSYFYSRDKILTAAGNHFSTIIEHGRLGRYPLFTFDI